jgi:hypothetical protein
MSSNSKHLSRRRQSALFRLTVPGAAKRTRRRKQTKRTQRRRQASPLTPEEIKQLKRRRPLWSKEASDAFEFAVRMDAMSYAQKLVTE